MDEQPKPKRPKYGGRKKGSLNKKTLAYRMSLDEALKKLANPDGSGTFHGSAHDYLMLVYKTEAFSPDMRMKAAADALRYEKPALAAVDSRALVEHKYVVEMPEPIQGATPAEQLENWKKLYCENESVRDPEADARWQQQLLIAKAAAEKNGGDE